MRFRHLDLNLIIYLDALLAEGSVSRAAERVHISQSAMSDALARLRDYFQDRLFVQVGRSMVPTPLATSMHQPIRDILLQVDLSPRPTFNSIRVAHAATSASWRPIM